MKTDLDLKGSLIQSIMTDSVVMKSFFFFQTALSGSIIISYSKKIDRFVRAALAGSFLGRITEIREQEPANLFSTSAVFGWAREKIVFFQKIGENGFSSSTLSVIILELKTICSDRPLQFGGIILIVGTISNAILLISFKQDINSFNIIVRAVLFFLGCALVGNRCSLKDLRESSRLIRLL